MDWDSAQDLMNAFEAAANQAYALRGIDGLGGSILAEREAADDNLCKLRKALVDALLCSCSDGWVVGEK